MYLLDTNIISYLQAGNLKVVTKINQNSPLEISTCSIVLSELYFGVFLNPHKQEILKKKYEELLNTVTIFGFNERESILFAQLKVELRNDGKIIEDFDLAIASIALANDLILVTNNTKHFKAISKLKLEDWTK